jgi:uncharacterized RDD family membrane protein YckC
MKCPKCGYLGFETTERCRHCGYDFSLSAAVETDAASALPLRDSAETEAPLGDFDLSRYEGDVAADSPAVLDLDRMIGDSPASSSRAPAPQERTARAIESAAAVATPPSLPLFTATQKVRGDAPVAPPPARPPLAVRRATPEVPRRRTPRAIRHDVDEMGLQLEPVATATESSEVADRAANVASPVRRVVAALIDVAILGGMNAAVIYLTLAITGLSLAEWRAIPPVPMAAFLLLLNGGYLAGFTAANGQTIGKMVAGIRVLTDEGERVTIAGAVLRSAGALISVALAGLPLLPALLSEDGRALHDRLAGTRVVRSA